MHNKNTEKWPSIKDHKPAKSTKVKEYETKSGKQMWPQVSGQRKNYNV